MGRFHNLKGPAMSEEAVDWVGFTHLWDLLAAQLFSVPSTDSLFNPYRDADPAYDLPHAAATRRANLRAYLRSWARRPDLLMVGEAIGYRGGRFSGVPLVSEQLLLTSPLFTFGGRQTSHHGPYSEQTATLFWGALALHRPRIFTWNAVPLHTHKPGEPMSNRTPTAAEVRAFGPLLGEIVNIIKPNTTVALGKKAEAALAALGLPCRYVRHPANGGATRFRQGIGLVL